MFRILDVTSKCQKCCCYFSTDKGTRAWGIFLSVIISFLLVLLPILISILVSGYDYTKDQNDSLVKRFIVFSFVLVSLIVESVFQFYFMAGMFKKRIEYLKFYKKYSIILMVTLVVSGLVTSIIFAMSEFNGDAEEAYYIGIILTILIVFLLQSYVKTFVIDIIKEHESLPVVVSVFARLENSEAEDEYTMRIEI